MRLVSRKAACRDLPMPYAFRCAAALLGMLGAWLCLACLFIQPYQFQVGSGAGPRSAPTPVQARTGADLEKPTPSWSMTAPTDRPEWNQSSKPARVRNKTYSHRLDHQALYRRLSEVVPRGTRRAMDSVNTPHSSFGTTELTVVMHGTSGPDVQSTQYANSLRHYVSPQESEQARSGEPRHSPGDSPEVIPWNWRTRLLYFSTLLACCGSLVCLAMMNNPAEATMRTPPRWSPEQESTYSFNNFSRDVLLWTLVTDLQPYQQCAAVIQRLGGTARELARQMTPQEMLHGGNINGVPADPITLLFHGLQQRFAPLGDETRSTSY